LFKTFGLKIIIEGLGLELGGFPKRDYSSKKGLKGGSLLGQKGLVGHFGQVNL